MFTTQTAFTCGRVWQYIRGVSDLAARIRLIAFPTPARRSRSASTQAWSDTTRRRHHSRLPPTTKARHTTPTSSLQVSAKTVDAPLATHLLAPAPRYHPRVASCVNSLPAKGEQCYNSQNELKRHPEQRSSGRAKSLHITFCTSGAYEYEYQPAGVVGCNTYFGDTGHKCDSTRRANITAHKHLR